MLNEMPERDLRYDSGDDLGKVGMDEGGDIHWSEAVVRESSGVWLCIREPSLWPWYETVA